MRLVDADNVVDQATAIFRALGSLKEASSTILAAEQSSRELQAAIADLQAKRDQAIAEVTKAQQDAAATKSKIAADLAAYTDGANTAKANMDAATKIAADKLAEINAQVAQATTDAQQKTNAMYAEARSKSDALAADYMSKKSEIEKELSALAQHKRDLESEIQGLLSRFGR